MRPASAVLAASLVLASSSGCFSTHTQPTLIESGFLTDYALLARADDLDRVQLLYRNPKVDFAAYDKVMFERITIWVAHEQARGEVASEDFEHMADDMFATVYAALAQDYKIVDEPGPGVMRIYLALTHVSAPTAPHDVFSSYGSPDIEVATDRGELDSAAETFVNEAYIELEILDSVTRDIMVEALDPWTRQTHLERGSATSWRQVHEAFEFWADRLQTRLGQARRGEI